MSTFARPLYTLRAFARAIPLGLALLNDGALKLGNTTHKPQHQFGDRVSLRRIGLPRAQKPHRDPAAHQILDNRVQTDKVSAQGAPCS